MKNRISKKIIKALSKTLSTKNCSLHEPWFDRSEIKYLSSAIKKNQFQHMVKKLKYLKIK